MTKTLYAIGSALGALMSDWRARGWDTAALAGFSMAVTDIPEELRGKTPEELIVTHKYLTEVLRDMHQDATTGEIRSLNADEQIAFDEGMAMRDKAQEMIDEHNRISEAFRKNPKALERAWSVANRGVDDPFGDVRRLTVPEARERALRTLDERSTTSHMTAPQKEQVEKTIRRDTNIARRILVTENEDYRSAWMKMVTQTYPFLSAEETQAMRSWQEFRAMAEGTNSGADGGYGIPVFIDPSIILTAQESDNPFLMLARQVNTNTNEWKGVTTAGVTWSFDAEASEVSDDSPTLAQPTVNVFMARGFIPYSIELGEDYPSFAEEMAYLLAAGYDDLLLTKFSVGSGNGEPEGLITKLDATTSAEVLITTAGTFGAVDLYKAWAALGQKYRRRASFMSTVGVNNTARQFANGNNFGNVTVDLTAPYASTLFGKGVYENDHLTDFTSTTGHQNVLVVGDFSNYVIARRGGMSVELVPTLFGLTNNRPTGQRGWFAHARIGGGVVNTAGFKLLNQT